jgi:hydrogenase expression/formation protein HypE
VFILAEGLPIADLRRVVASMNSAAKEAGVRIVAGDTKVVERASCDGMFITTSGVGVFDARFKGFARAPKPGDRIIVSGTMGDHGIAVMSQREGMRFGGSVRSDSAPLNGLVERILGTGAAVSWMRDVTRGGLGTIMNELAGQSGLGVEIDESAIPVSDAVRGASEMLGLDVLYIANEGKLAAVVDGADAARVVAAMRRHKYGRRACVAGEIVSTHPGTVLLNTGAGGRRIVDMLSGEQLPRIC